MKPLRPSRFVSTLTSAAILVLLCLAPAAFAQLPNAWQITDKSGASGSGLSYTNILNAGLRTAATNAGFDFSINARFVTDYGAGTNTMVMIYGDGRTRWEILWSLNTNGDLVSELITNVGSVQGQFFVVTTNGTGRALYHTHEIIYNPTSRLASYLVDGQVLTANWAGSTPGNWTAGQVEWGAGSSAGIGAMNFHTVTFGITNGIVAAYDAGTENNPNNAPAPQTQGWTNTPGTLLSGTSTNGISPDRGPDVVTTLADSDYGSLRQTISDARSGDTITFFTNGVITLTSGELLIMNNLTIAGPGPANLTLNGGGNSGIFEIASSNVVTLDSLTLTNGLSSDGGAIYLNSGGNLTVKNSILSGNSATNNGGAIDNAGTLTLSNCIVTINTALVGGGIFNELDATFTINDSILSGDSATNNGGGMVNYGATLALTNCILSDNSAGNNGGGIENYAATLALDGSTMSNNFATVGGGICNESGSTLTLNNSALSDNSADFGGGIENAAALLTLNNSVLSGNSAGNNGGGIDSDYGSTLMLINSTLAGNSAAYGGGIENYAATLTLNHSILSDNSAAGYGGAIDNEDSGTAMLVNSTLSSDSATGGGGIENNNAALTLNNTVLSGNVAAGYGGGGIDNEHGGTVTLDSSTLSGNSAPGCYGGGIQNEDGMLTLNGSTLSGNSAGYGGGIYNEYGSTNVLNNSTFSGNSADYDGGSIANSGTIKLNNSTFSGNFATYVNGGIYQDTGTSVLTNTIVSGNTALGSPNISGSFSGAHNLNNAYPLLAPLGNYGGLTQTMPPLAGSPAIDAGLDAVTNFLATDQRGYARKSGAHVDIGAVESHMAPANNRPQLKNSAMQANGVLSFSFTNVPNTDFTVLASTNIAAPLNQWILLGLTVQGAPGQYQFTDPGATNYPRRFYQVVSP